MDNSNQEVFRDRLEALQAGGADSLVKTLRRLPMVAAAATGEGPLTDRASVFGYRRTRGPLNTTRDMATLLANPLTVGIALVSATRIEYQLLALAVFHGGILSRDETMAVTGARPDTLDRAAEGLADLLLADPTKGWVAPRPGVVERVWLPGTLFRRASEHIHSPELADRLNHLGITPPPPRKWERVDALEEALRNPEIIERAVARLEPEETALFDRLVKAGGLVILDDWDLPTNAIYGPNPLLNRLASTGLIGYSRWERVAWVWLDVIVALSGGRMFSDWEEPQAEKLPLAVSGGPRIPTVVGHLDLLLDHWSSTAPKALKSGGLGVKPIRAAAKALGMPPAEVGLLASLAIGLGLLATVVTGRRGRGRNQVVDEEWRPTTACHEWRQDPAARRWARLVQQWQDDVQLDVSGKTIERWEWDTPDLNRPLARASLLQTLTDLPDGMGLDPADMTERVVFDHYGMMLPATVIQLVDEARILGLVPAEGPVGLAPAGRLLFEGADALEEIAADAPRNFTVQADHTVITPPDLAPEVLVDLERFTSIESEAGARIYRITVEDTIRALDSGWTAEEILSFLAAGSNVPVAQNVERTIRDSATEHGRITVGTSATWIACDDPAILARAVAVKTAKLEAISDTLAVSELPKDKVLAALRSKGLAPRERSVEAPASEPSPRIASDDELRTSLLPTEEDIAGLVTRVLTDTQPDSLETDADPEQAMLRLIESSRDRG